MDTINFRHNFITDKRMKCQTLQFPRKVFHIIESLYFHFFFSLHIVRTFLHLIWVSNKWENFFGFVCSSRIQSIFAIEKTVKSYLNANTPTNYDKVALILSTLDTVWNTKEPNSIRCTKRERMIVILLSGTLSLKSRRQQGESFSREWKKSPNI